MESKKILKKKNVIIAIILLLILQICLFWFREADEWAIKPDVNEHVATFHEEIERIVKESDSMGMISIFAKKDSFSSNNLEQTKMDFKKLLAVEPVAFDGEFLLEFLTDSSGSLLMLLAGIFLVLALDEENKPGLRSMIFSTVKGRSILAIWKIRALLFWDGIISALFVGGTLITSCAKYSGNLWECLLYPVQSLPMLGDLPWVANMGTFLLAYWVYRWIVLFVISLCIWCILQYANHLVLGVGVVAVIGLANFITYTLIGASHSLNVLHYCNIYYLLKDASFFSEYKNLNIFNEAINKNLVIVVVFFVVFIGAAAMAIWLGEHKYPYTSKVNKVAGWIEARQKSIFVFSSKIQERLSLSGAEFYKVLITQRGLIIIVLVIGFIFQQIDFREIQRTGTQDLYYAFMEEYTCAPCEESEAEIERIRNMVGEVEAKYLKASELYQEEKITLEELIGAQKLYEMYYKEIQFLEMIDNQTQYIEEISVEKGVSAWYVNEYSFYHLLDEEDTISNLLLIFAIVLLCSNTFSWEERGGTTKIIRGSAEGRRPFFMNKMKANFWIVTGLFLVTTLLRIGSVKLIYGLQGLSAPIQSVRQLSFMDLQCSIGTFIVMLYFAKLLMFLAVAGIISGLSLRYKQKTMIAVFGILCIPSILAWVGFEAFRYISLTEISSITSFFLQMKSLWGMAFIVMAFVGACVYCIVTSYRKWCRT